MTTVLARAGAVVLAAVAMLSLLLGLAAVALGRPDRLAAYLAVTAVSGLAVAALMRRDARRQRAEGAPAHGEMRAQRRAGRRAISFPLREAALVFAFWYVAALVLDRAASGATGVFTLVAIAPFAAFMLTALTLAGRHIAFRLTAEEAADERSD